MEKTDYYIDEKIENCYKNVIQPGIDVFKQRLINYTIICIILLTGLPSFLIYYKIKFNTSIPTLLILGIILIPIIYLFLLPPLVNKKYKFYGIKLGKPHCFSSQKKAIKEYNQIIYKKFEEELILEGLLSGTKDDVEMLHVYIQRFKNKRQRNYHEPLIINGRISFIILILSVPIQFAVLFFNKNEDTIYDLFKFIFFTIYILALIYFTLYVISRLWADIINKKTITQDRISDFLEVIRINRLLSSNNIEQLKEKITIS